MTVLISPSFSQEGFKTIKNSLDGLTVTQPNKWTEDKECRALIIRSKDIIDSSFLKMFPNAEVIVSATSGFDHITYPQENLTLCYSPKANTQSAAELTLFHILNFIKKGPLITSAKNWRESQMLSQELSSKKVSILGLGKIGSRVAKTLQAFGCTDISAYDPYIKDDVFKKIEVKKVEIDEALKTADILTLHCPLTKKTQNIINKTTLNLMQSDSLLVNCARGELVNTADLLNALDQNQISGACLDVFDKEPLESASKIRNHPLIQWSPHVGAYTKGAQIKSALEAAQQIKSWFKGDMDMLHSLPPKVAWAKDL